MSNKLKEITNWKYHVDYDDNRSECHKDHGGDYCRCRTVSPKITGIYYDGIYQQIVGHKEIKSISEYVVDRMVRSLNIYDFNAYGESGYYGEETQVDLESSGEEKINRIYNLINYSDRKIIDLSLESEYGFVLDGLKRKKVKTLEVLLKDVKLPSDQYKRVDQNIVNKYCEIEEIWLLVKEAWLKYDLVDGYHRYVSAVKTNKKHVKAIIFYD